MAEPDEQSWWGSIPNQLFLALVGFLIWWLQDTARANREGILTLHKEQQECRRDYAEVVFRVKTLETRADIMRAALLRRLSSPAPDGPYEGMDP